MQPHSTDLQFVGREFVVRQVPPLPLSFEEPGTAPHAGNRLLPVDGLPLTLVEVNVIATAISGDENLVRENNNS